MAMDEKGVENAAILLMSLGEEQAAEVFKHLAPKEVQRLGETIAKMKGISRERNEVMVRIATLDGIQPVALKDLNEVMSKVLAGGDKLRKASLGGAKTAAEIINLLGSAVETSVLDYIREADNDLAQKIMDNM